MRGFPKLTELRPIFRSFYEEGDMACKSLRGGCSTTSFMQRSITRVGLAWIMVATGTSFAKDDPRARPDSKPAQTTVDPAIAEGAVSDRPPSFEDKVFVRGADGRWHPKFPALPVQPPSSERDDERTTALPDVYLADGAETSIAFDIGNSDNIVAGFNGGFFLVSPNMMTSANANGGPWTARTFPNGTAPFGWGPFDPWAFSGNAASELFMTFLIRDGTANCAFSNLTRVLISRSVNAGAAWAAFYEETNNAVFQDREMADNDRTTARGGGANAAHDGKVCLCFDDFGVNGQVYVQSLIQIISAAGARLNQTALPVVGVGSYEALPVAATTDGQFFLMARIPGRTQTLQFFEITGANSATVAHKSSFSFDTVGWQFRSRAIINGHRTDEGGYMDIDRSTGPRRGRVYVVTNRNPNPAPLGNGTCCAADGTCTVTTQVNCTGIWTMGGTCVPNPCPRPPTVPTTDQGDIWISYTDNFNAATPAWTHRLIPGTDREIPGGGGATQTQYMPMMDVDLYGAVHVVYYENTPGGGAPDSGVFTARFADVYYTCSLDGGTTWSAAPTKVNNAANQLDYHVPPGDCYAAASYVIGDYQGIQAARRGFDSRVFVLWTTYDKDRGGFALNNAAAQVICTTITDPLCQNCKGDLNRDNMVNGRDITLFKDCMLLANPGDDPICHCADMNADRALTNADLDAFTTRLVAANANCP